MATEQKADVPQCLQLSDIREHLIRLEETCTYGPHLYLFLSPACEGDLLQLLEHGAMPEPDAAAITRGLLLALAALHRAGIAHCDVKPQNVLYRTRE